MSEEVTIIPTDLSLDYTQDKVKNILTKFQDEYLPLAKELNDTYQDIQNQPISEPSNDEEYQRLVRIKKSITTPINTLETKGKEIRRDMKSIVNDPSLDLEKKVKSNLSPLKEQINNYLDNYRYEQKKIANQMVLVDRQERLQAQEFKHVKKEEFPSEENLLDWDDNKFLVYFNNLKQLEQERQEEEEQRLSRDAKIAIVSSYGLGLNSGDFSVSFETIDSSTEEEITTLCKKLKEEKDEQIRINQAKAQEQQRKKTIAMERRAELRSVDGWTNLDDEALYALDSVQFDEMYQAAKEKKEQKEREEQERLEEQEKEKQRKLEQERMRQEGNKEKINTFLYEHGITQEMIDTKQAKIEKTQSGDYAVYTLVGYITLD